MIGHIYPSMLQAVSGRGLCRVPGAGVFRGSGVRLCRILDMNFRELLFRDCMKRSQVRARRLIMRRLIAAYTNASPLAHSRS